MTTALTTAQKIRNYYMALRDKTYVPTTCQKLTMQKFNLTEPELEAAFAQAKSDNARQCKQAYSSTKAEQRRKSGPAIVTRCQLLADFAEMADLPRDEAVQKLATYYGLTPSSVNQRLAWNPETSGNATGKPFEVTPERMRSKLEELREANGLPPKEHAGEFYWEAS